VAEPAYFLTKCGGGCYDTERSEARGVQRLRKRSASYSLSNSEAADGGGASGALIQRRPIQKQA